MKLGAASLYLYAWGPAPLLTSPVPHSANFSISPALVNPAPHRPARASLFPDGQRVCILDPAAPRGAAFGRLEPGSARAQRKKHLKTVESHRPREREGWLLVTH